MKNLETNVLGMGLPIIDRIGIVSSIPNSRSIKDLIKVSKNIEPKDGGVIPNVLANYVALSDEHTRVQLMASVGDDQLGLRYLNKLDPRISNVLIIEGTETAQLFDLLLPDGSELWQLFLNAAAHANANETHYQHIKKPNSYLLVDINTIREDSLEPEFKKIISAIDGQKNRLIINLSGIQGIDINYINHVASLLTSQPIAIFGNEVEFSILKDSNFMQFIKPEALLVKTLAEKGSLISFNREKLYIPPTIIHQNLFASSIGCGDSYMGAFLAIILTEKPEYWSKRNLQRAGLFASFIGSETAKSPNSRLDTNTLQNLKRSYFSTTS